MTYVIEANDENFHQEVIERSREIPVVLDFWASWCQPCLMLGPMLEELAEKSAGRFVLAKVESDAAPNAASQFNVQALPAVYGLVDGEAVDFFAGVKPPEQLESWVNGLLRMADLNRAAQLERSDVEQAEAAYRRLAEEEPNDPAPRIAIARLCMESGRTEEAKEIIERLEERGFLEPEAERVKSQLSLQSGDRIDVDQVRAAANASPDDLDKQLDLARALASEEQSEEALELALSLIQRDKARMAEPCRELMVDIFRVLGDDSELTRTYRRKLGTALY